MPAANAALPIPRVEPRLVSRLSVSNELDLICLNLSPQWYVVYDAVPNALYFVVVADADLPPIGAHGSLVAFATSGV